MKYASQHFKRELLFEDMVWRGGLRPGEEMPDFDVPTTDGGRLRKADFVGVKQLLQTFGSVTCPVTDDADPKLKHQRFGGRVAFATLYVREAHPGDRYPSPARASARCSSPGAQGPRRAVVAGRRRWHRRGAAPAAGSQAERLRRDGHGREGRSGRCGPTTASRCSAARLGRHHRPLAVQRAHWQARPDDAWPRAHGRDAPALGPGRAARLCGWRLRAWADRQTSSASDMRRSLPDWRRSVGPLGHRSPVECGQEGVQVVVHGSASGSGGWVSGFPRSRFGGRVRGIRSGGCGCPTWGRWLWVAGQLGAGRVSRRAVRGGQ